MAKTYNVVPDKASGDVFTEAMWDDSIKTNINNLRVPPMVRAIRSGTQSHGTSGTYVNVQYNGTDSFDTDAMHDPASNNTRITFTTAGVYQVTALVDFAPNATGIRAGRILLNNATQIAITVTPNAGGADGTAFLVSTLYNFAVNDYIEIGAFQASGGALNLTANNVVQAHFIGQVS